MSHLTDEQQAGIRAAWGDTPAETTGSLKVGDTVRIKSLSWFQVNRPTLIGFTDDMLEFCGCCTKIIGVYYDSKYMLSIDCGAFLWTANMFEPASISEEAPEAEVSKPTPPDWQQLFTSYCGMALQGLLADGGEGWIDSYNKVTEKARKYASVMVRTLKQEWKDDKGFGL